MFESLALQLRGMEWIIVIVVIVILIFGASKIPQLARAIGRSTGEFKKGRLEAEREAAALTTPEEEARIKLVKAARELGIATDGKSNDQIREEINKTLAK